MSAVSSQNGKEQVIFIGTYTEPEQSTSEGIYVYGMDPSSGKLTFKNVVKDLINPSYLAIHPQTGYIYAVHEKGTFEGQPGGGVIALSVDPQTGDGRILNKQSSGGEDPCYNRQICPGRQLQQRKRCHVPDPARWHPGYAFACG